ncbi:30S ribosomal protein S16 [Geodia barretti]|uniref:Small ribosomal subunit protein bS16m n=1 Tax=Geodia barretti TaxID=519541 RepID=A0AA35T5X3_GEOBA|nr:30S ribosomal protein S16 [Geodia barretti]
MLRIRLSRIGKKKKPSYRIVVAEAKAPRDGSYIEWIGTYDPMQNPPAININLDRAQYWLGHGAQPSDPVKRIIEKGNGLAAVGASAAGEDSAAAEEPSEESEA